MPDFILDAQAALGFVVSQTSHIETQVNETVYPDVQYPELVPVDTSAHPFAKSVTYYSSDKFGKADWINGNGDDIPRAGTERDKHETSVHMAGIGYGYGFEEINQAQMLGVDLEADDASAARRVSEEKIDQVALLGDASKGYNGLINNPGVTVAPALTGGWSTASPAAMLKDVNAALEGVGASTLYTALANTLLLPQSVSQFLSEPMPGTTMPVMEYIQKYNIYTMQTGQPLTIRFIRGLDTAGAGDTKRMVAYRRAPEVLKMHIPMPHRFLPPVPDGALSILVPGVFRVGGLDVRRPAEMRYVDGL